TGHYPVAGKQICGTRIHHASPRARNQAFSIMQEDQLAVYFPSSNGAFHHLQRNSPLAQSNHPLEMLHVDLWHHSEMCGLQENLTALLAEQLQERLRWPEY